MSWHGESWNFSGGNIPRLVIAVEHDEDTELAEWCWRVGRNGKVLAEGRARSESKALDRALKEVRRG